MRTALKKINRRITFASGAVWAPASKRLSALTAPVFAQLSSRYQKLDPRERLLIKVAGAALCLLLGYNLVYLPLKQTKENLNRRVETAERDLKEVRRLVDVYVQRKAELAAAEKHTVPGGKDFSLFSVLEQSLTQSVGREKIGSIVPGADHKLSDGLIQYSVELKLQQVSLTQIVDALYGVKALSVPITVSNLRVVRRTQDPHSYDVDITCLALGKNG